MMNSIEALALLGISATTLLSLAYFIFLDFMKKNHDSANETRIKTIYIWRKIVGFMLFGIVPAIIVWPFFKLPPVHFGLALGDSLSYWPWLLGASAFFILLNVFNSRNPELKTGPTRSLRVFLGPLKYCPPAEIFRLSEILYDILGIAINSPVVILYMQ